jgi:hypothetical protein
MLTGDRVGEYVPIVVGLIAGILSNIGKLFSEKRWERGVGWALLVCTVFGSGWAVYTVNKKNEQIDRLTQTDIVEASGGTTDANSTAYVVDDELPLVFVHSLSENGALYKEKGSIELRNRRGVSVSLSDDKRDRVDDLEGAAWHKSKLGHTRLFLVTSHSADKDGEEKPARRKLLEVSLDTTHRGTILRHRDLRPLIESEFHAPHGDTGGRITAVTLSEKRKNQVMQIEGLAIDEDGIPRV